MSVRRLSAEEAAALAMTDSKQSDSREVASFEDAGQRRRLMAEMRAGIGPLDARELDILRGVCRAGDEGYLRWVERRDPSGLASFVAARFAEPELSPLRRSILLEYLARAGSEPAFAWLDALLGSEDWGNVVPQCVGRAIRTFGANADFGPRMRARLADALAKQRPPRPWTMLTAELTAVAAEVLPPPDALAILRGLTPAPGSYDEHCLQRLVVALQLRVEPEALLAPALARALSAREDPSWSAVLVALAEDEVTRDRARLALEDAVRGSPALLRRLSVLVALRRCEASLTGTRLTAHQSAKLERCGSRARDVADWLVREGWIDAAPADVPLGLRLDTAADPAVVRATLEACGVGLGLDAESGSCPVPYAELLGSLAALFPFEARVRHEPSSRGHRYTIVLGARQERVELTFEDGSDYFDVARILEGLNALMESLGERRRWSRLRTEDQGAFVVLAEPARLQALVATWDLRAS